MNEAREQSKQRAEKGISVFEKLKHPCPDSLVMLATCSTVQQYSTSLVNSHGLSAIILELFAVL